LGEQKKRLKILRVENEVLKIKLASMKDELRRLKGIAEMQQSVVGDIQAAYLALVEEHG